MDVAIRRIEEKDYPAVAALLVNELWDNRYSGDYVAPFFNKIKNNEDYVTFVALLNNEVVGVISAILIFWAAYEPPNTLFVQGLAVKNEYQNKGIGSELLRSIEDYARERRVTNIGLCSGVQRTAAHAFYERNGYTKGSNYAFGKTLKHIE
jgi:ribosomal protein S18 acetylase RimI-like enzyme